MIEGLYESHLPVRNLQESIKFYQGLGLELSHAHEDRLAFFWIKKDIAGLVFGNRIKQSLHILHPSDMSLFK